MKVRMLESTTFEGVEYVRGEVYTMDKKSASALGSSVEVIGKSEDDDSEPKTKKAAEPKKAEVKNAAVTAAQNTSLDKGTPQEPEAPQQPPQE